MCLGSGVCSPERFLAPRVISTRRTGLTSAGIGMRVEPQPSASDGSVPDCAEQEAATSADKDAEQGRGPNAVPRQLQRR